MIRKVRLNEVRRVVEFMQEFREVSKFVEVDVEKCVENYTALMEIGNTHVYIMEENGELHGAIGFIIHPDLTSGILVAVETLWYVTPKHRGKGAELLKKYEEEAAKLGAKKIGMVFMQDSHPEQLKAFYIKKWLRATRTTLY